MSKTWHPIRRAKKIYTWNKKHRASVKKRRAAREKKRAEAAKKTGTSPAARWWTELLDRASAAAIDVHMDVESATGFQNPGNPFRDRPLTKVHKQTAVEHAEHRSAAIERRQHKRGKYFCHAHTPPMRFATPTELAAHVEEHEDKPEPTKVMPAPTPKSPKKPESKPESEPKPTRTRTKPAPRPVKRKTVEESTVETMKADQRDLNGILAKWVPHIDQIREGAVKSMGATTGVELLGEIGTTPVQSVSQVRELALALEALGSALEEGVTGFRQNARQSPTAPIDEEVLRELQPMIEGGAQVARSAVRFLAAFEEFYGPEIRKAQNEERMSNAALVN